MKIAPYIVAAAACVFTSATLAQPVITQVLKSGGSTAGGETLCLLGTFPAGTPTVTIGSRTATVQQSTPTIILCLTPTPAGQNLQNLSIRVAIAGQNSNVMLYSYDRPFISQINPPIGPTSGFTQFLIDGANFGPNPTVLIGGLPVQRLFSTEFSFTGRTSPGQGTNLPVLVLSAPGMLNDTPATFSYNPPTLSNINPPLANTQGGTIALTGTNFGQTPVVRVGTQDISPVPGSVTATGLQFQMPAGTGTGIPLSVVVAEQVSNSLTISYGPPSISFGTPAIGSTSGGTAVNMGGTNLGPASSTQVLFDGLPVAIQPGSAGHTGLTFRTPPGEGTNHSYWVVTGGQVSNSRPFSYLPPVINSISPSNVSVDGNDLVLISGTDLGINPTVYIGETIAPVVMSNHTSILCRAPAHVSAVASVNVIVAGQPSNQSTINYICDADFNGDGAVDFFDYLDFVDAYSISC